MYNGLVILANITKQMTKKKNDRGERIMIYFVVIAAVLALSFAAFNLDYSRHSHEEG